MWVIYGLDKGSIILLSGDLPSKTVSSFSRERTVKIRKRLASFGEPTGSPNHKQVFQPIREQEWGPAPLLFHAGRRGRMDLRGLEKVKPLLRRADTTWKSSRMTEALL